MPGRGPAPVDPSRRRRRNVPARGEWVDLPEVWERRLGELPGPPERWSARTRAAWEAWACDPATTQYGPSDLAAVEMLAWVMEESVQGRVKPSEVRLWMDGLGLTPKGKRDLRWRVAAAGEVVALEERRSAAERMEDIRKRAAQAGRSAG